MSDNKSTVLEQVISAAVGLEGPTMWQAIESKADALGQNPLLRIAAQTSVAFARLACFSNDGRHLVPAIRKFRQLMRFDILKDILDIALAFSETSAVQEIRRIAAYTGSTELSVENFEAWFIQQGVRWFDIYQDDCTGMTFVDLKDIHALKILVAHEYPDQSHFWHKAYAMTADDKHYPPVRRALLQAIAEGREAIVPTEVDQRVQADQLFRDYAALHNIRILRQLASGQNGLRCCSNVYLALDSDGIIKIYKEILMHTEERVGSSLNIETDIFPLLTDMGDVVPRYYDRIELTPELAFMVRACVFGQSLADYAYPERLLDKHSVCTIILDIARIIQELHERDILYLDLRPDNVLVSHNGAKLFDFNASRHAPNLQDTKTEVTAYILDPKFAPPEVTLRCRASKESDIFQLGLLFHQLLYGKLPFVTVNELEHGDAHREQAVLKFSLANALLPYEHHPENDFEDDRLTLIKMMLSKNPRQRPTAKEVIQILGASLDLIKLEHRAADNLKEDNTVIFPARMGIPHYGHIDYISRVLDLGYHVLISLQRSYTITDRDPLPKWLVLKMVARSLIARGYSPTSFSFMLTPFFETDIEHRLHFAMLPEMADVVAVASSNPDISAIFPELLILDQKTVFGQPEERFTDRSWGERLRVAIKYNDRATFKHLAATGVSKIMPFDEIRARYAETPVNFLPGKVIVSVTNANNVTQTARVRKYDLPEQIAAELLQAKILKPFDRDSLIQTVDGQCLRLCYEKMTVTNGDETIYFKIKPE